MVQPWPHVQKEMISIDAEEKMKELIELVATIRNMRSVWNLEPKREIEVIINIHKTGDEKTILENIDFVKRLARASKIDIGKFAKPKNAASGIVGSLEVFLPLEGLIDFDKERLRLKKEEIRMASEIKSISGRLKDKNFTSKAPEEVVAKQEAYKAELELQIKKLRNNLKEIG
jgi:valyl-tRNA synthetase